MKKIVFLLSLIALISCQQQEIPVPEAKITCSTDYSSHPTHSAYQSLVDSLSSSGITGINVLVDHPIDGLWMGSSGYADIEANIPLTPCHLHYSASIIKTYIAVIILQLVEEGKLSLDDQLDPYVSNGILDKIPNGHTATIRHLLQCRSGMPDVFEADFLLDFLNQPTRLYTMEELIRYVYGVEPIAAPGERFYYSDANFILLSMIIEQLDGDLRSSYQKRIFQALEMEQAHLVDQPEQIPDGVVASYWDRYGNGLIENVSDMQIALAAGLEGTDGLITSVEDMNLFMRGLVDGSLINPTSFQALMDVIDIPEGDSQQNYSAYGLGIARVQVSEEVWFGSFGNHVGAAQIMLYNPAHQTTIIAAQNTGTFFNDDLKKMFFYELIVKIEDIAFL